MHEGLFIQVGNADGRGPVNGEIGPDGYINHGSIVGPGGTVHNVYNGGSAGVDPEDEGDDMPVDGAADAGAELSVVPEDIVSHFETAGGSVTNVVQAGARIGGRIIQLGDVSGDINL